MKLISNLSFSYHPFQDDWYRREQMHVKYHNIGNSELFLMIEKGKVSILKHEMLGKVKKIG